MTIALTVGTNTYINLADAKTYFGDKLQSSPWDAADDDTKSKALITAARMLDRQLWKNQKTDPTQVMAFPRTGLTDKNGTTILNTVVPQDIIDGQCELANALLENLNLQNQTSSQSNVKSMTAGTVALTFAVNNGNSTTRFPVLVNEYVGRFLASSYGIPYAGGTDVESVLDASYDMNRPII